MNNKKIRAAFLGALLTVEGMTIGCRASDEEIRQDRQETQAQEGEESREAQEISRLTAEATTQAIRFLENHGYAFSSQKAKDMGDCIKSPNHLDTPPDSIVWNCHFPQTTNKGHVYEAWLKLSKNPDWVVSTVYRDWPSPCQTRYGGCQLEVREVGELLQSAHPAL